MSVYPEELATIIDGVTWVCRARDDLHPHGPERLCFQEDHKPFVIYVVLSFLQRRMSPSAYQVKLFSSPGQGALKSEYVDSWAEGIRVQDEMMRQAEALVMEHRL